MYKSEINPKCVLCAKEEENIEHFILNCKSLSKVRNTILHELITTFNTLGIEFDELSANEKLENGKLRQSCQISKKTTKAVLQIIDPYLY